MQWRNTALLCTPSELDAHLRAVPADGPGVGVDDARERRLALSARAPQHAHRAYKGCMHAGHIIYRG